MVIQRISIWIEKNKQYFSILIYWEEFIMIKKIAMLSGVLGLTFSASSHAELYTNFYNNSKDGLQIRALDLGNRMESNAKVGMEIKPQPNGYPPHIWLKATGSASNKYRRFEIGSKTNPDNWCRFFIPFNLTFGEGIPAWQEEDFSGLYKVESFGNFRCYLQNRHGNTAHLNIDLK